MIIAPQINHHDMLYYLNSAGQIIMDSLPQMIYRSGPFPQAGEMMSDYEDFDTLGPLPPKPDENGGDDDYSDQSNSQYN
jgi:hypothetical protein